MNATEPIDALHWGTQTRLRQSWEAFQWQFSQWLKSSSKNEDSSQWGRLLPVLLWTLRILGLVLLAVVIYLLARQMWQWWTQWINRPSRVGQMEPSEPIRSRLDWLAIAQEAQSRQDYHRAFEALYKALLAHLRDDWVMLFRTHEALCFGGIVLQQRQFDQCRTAYDTLVPYLEAS
jgi:hypothetical protein